MPNTYVRHVAQEFADHARLARNSGISSQELLDFALPVTVEQHLQIIRNAVDLADTRTDWYFDWGQRMAAHFHGPITLALLSARCLGDGLDAFLKFIPGRVPYHRWSGYAERDYFVCQVEELIDLGTARTTLVEIPLLVMHEYVRTLRPGTLAGARIEVSYAAPPHLTRYEQSYLCPVFFQQARNALIIPHAWREVRNVGYDEATWLSAMQQCQALCVTKEELDALNAVRRVLFSYFNQHDANRPVPTLEDVAEVLHLSPRTLMRRLRALDTTYQKVCDGVQKHRARELLANPALSVQAVATTLGYGTATSLVRAFKRWYGMTPGAYRTDVLAVSSVQN